MMGKVTIKDVAREAGVSISTVSNALNGVDVLLPDTKAHILAVAERMHYIPNLNGRNLKARAMKVIGLFVTYMGGPYMGALTDSAARQCQEAGYELNVFVTGQNSSIMANLLGHRVDGAVIVNSSLSKQQEEELKAAEIPVVYLNREIEGEYQAGVFFDSYKAGRMAAECFLKKGLHSLGLVEGPDNYDSRERSRGFRDVLAMAGLPLKEEFVWQGGFSREKAYSAVTLFLQKTENGKQERDLPQAVFAANDQSAIGCLEAFLQAGIAVPDTVKVLGCDDIELGRYIKPALTTIRTNFEEQGLMAVKCLLSMLQGESKGRMTRLSCMLVERESV